MHFLGFQKVHGENIKFNLYQVLELPLVVNRIKFETYIH